MARLQGSASVACARVDDERRPHGLGDLPSCLQRLHDDELPRPVQRQDGGGDEPDGPAPDDGGRVARVDLRPRQALDDHGQGLDEGGLSEADRIRDGDG